MNESKLEAFSEIIENIKISNTIFRKILGYFYPKYHISSNNIQKIERLIKESRYIGLNHFRLNNFIFFGIIEYIKLPLSLKLAPYKVYFEIFYDEILVSADRFNNFCDKIILNFPGNRFKKEEGIKECKDFILMLLRISKSFINYQKEYYLIKSYFKLLKILININRYLNSSSCRYLKLFNIFKKIPKDYHILEGWFLLIRYVFNNDCGSQEIKNQVFTFFTSYEKNLMRELNSYGYPDPIKFCVFLDNLLIKNNLPLLLEIYLDFYNNHTSNFIPPLFFKKKHLKDSKIMELITRNLEHTRFDQPYLDKISNIILKYKPSEIEFQQYSKMIITLQNQIFPSDLLDNILNSKVIKDNQKLELLIKLYKKYPLLKWRRTQQKNVFLKINIKKNFSQFLEYIISSENYDDFLMFFEFLHKIHICKIQFLKLHYLKIKQIKRESFRSELENEKFLTLKRILELIEDDSYDIYKDNKYNSVEDFMLSEFKNRSYKLLEFLYNYLIRQATTHSNYDAGKRFREEFEIFKNEVNEKINVSKILYFYPLENYSDYHTSDFNIYLLLLNKGKKQELDDFIEEKIEEVKRKKYINNYIIGCLKYIKGDFQTAFEQFQIALDDSKKTLANIFIFKDENIERFYEQRLEHIEIIINLISFQKNLQNYCSFEDLLKDLNDLLVQFNNEQKFNMCFVSSEEVFLHYNNLSLFLRLTFNYINGNRPLCLRFFSLIKRTNFCLEWNNIIELWKDILNNKSPLAHIEQYSKEQFDIFLFNPLFKGLRIFFKNSINLNNVWYKLFNYENIIQQKYFDENNQRSLWREVYKFIKIKNRSYYYTKGDIECSVKKKLIEYLKMKFEVVLSEEQIISTNKRIDILVNDLIPIEIKRIEKMSKSYEAKGQIDNYMELGDFKFGIIFGILIKEFKVEKKEYITGENENISVILK